MNRHGHAFAAALLLSACQQSIEIGAQPTGAGGATLEAPSVAGTTTEAGTAPSGDMTPSGGAPATGAAGSTASAGAEPEAPASEVVWSSSVETGDVSDWTAAGPAEGGLNLHLATASVSTEQAHSGSHSVKLQLDASDGQDHLAELYRRIEAGPAYYGAWFFLSEQHTPAVYWTIFYFFSEKTAGNSATRQGMWDLNLNASSVYFYDEATKQFVDATPKKPYPIGQWFHVVAYLDHRASGTSLLSVWLDDEQILQVPQLSVPPSANVYWGIGSETDQLTPASCTMYIDDAVVSTSPITP